MSRGLARALTVVATSAAAVAALAGCSPSVGGSGGDGGGELTVSAAASLTEAFSELASDFEAAHPGARVRLNFGGSSALAEQVVSGAPVDVLATASRPTMDSVVDAGFAEDAPTFATNALTIAVPTGNPAGITSLADLADPDVRVAVCAPEVPCGAAAETTLANAGVAVTPVTLDPDVKAVLGRVASGEVDAGLVYATDVRTADVDGVAIPADIAATTDYAITVVKQSAQQSLAHDFVEFVLSPAGQNLLTARGFGAP